MDSSSVGALQKMSRRWRSGMRTILPGIFFTLISFAALCVSGKASACSFALQYGGKIQHGITTISNADRVALAELLVTVRDSVAKDGPVVIYGFADDNEHHAETIAYRRAEAVREYLLSLGILRDRINIDTKIWRSDSLVPPSERNQIEVEFVPACSPSGCESPCDATVPRR
ncbi:hypothetical protein DID96_14875 [Burkholderia sp. Bp8963]|uniref:OmpA family protein n=1 Tax=Burkholderia sp. Bp8963 TaxID=2184547 RepID=UPI000F596299|nr:OmpA family protein [Burkholderia sp. Bp8963]RQS70429.1 hypothetical protein DID96_14875 [Burkholderia sp. Bp8963]